ncbi:MAG TPA: flagellar motor protein MotB [Terracidiphilus sp.]|jgi:chemotaxis protein MotB|nr:flagellar motor protein MotB [Terracidiphilus sp.]
MILRPHRGRANHERWLVSYADFITLLFAFFVVLYAFAKADEKKQAQVSATISEAFQTMGSLTTLQKTQSGGSSNAHDRNSASAGAPDAANVVMPSGIASDLELIRRRLQHDLSAQIAQHVVSIQLGQDGLVISLREAGFFNSGSAEPRNGTAGTLQQIADSVRNSPFAIRVEGHTDDVPIHCPSFDSNWELSSARATRITRMLIEQDEIPGARLSAAGYAEYRPIANNATPEGRAANRRVDIVIMPRISLVFSNNALPPPQTWRTITDD